MNLDIMLTCVGTAITTVTVVYGFMRNIRADIKSDFDKLDNRIFQLAMGKTFKEILMEEKIEEEKK